ncbi:MAG: Cof-type HAD-IIB family hydrolase [Halanaerobiales bacterium]
MQYKLLVLDLDGTLLDEDHQLTDNTIRVINSLKKKGIKIIIATGRMFVSALPFVEQLALKGPVISYNGAYVKDVSTNTVLYHQPLEYSLAREMILTAEKEGLHINLYQDEMLYVARENIKSRLYEELSGVEARAVGRLSEFISVPPTKLLIIENEWKKQQYYLQFFQDKYGDRAEITESESNFIEIEAREVSKGEALAFLNRSYFQIEREKIVALGNAWNDYEMIKYAGTGIAMDNSPEELKEEADMIAPHHAREGAAEIIADLFS